MQKSEQSFKIQCTCLRNRPQGHKRETPITSAKYNNKICCNLFYEYYSASYVQPHSHQIYWRLKWATSHQSVVRNNTEAKRNSSLFCCILFPCFVFFLFTSVLSNTEVFPFLRTCISLYSFLRCQEKISMLAALCSPPKNSPDSNGEVILLHRLLNRASIT